MYQVKLLDENKFLKLILNKITKVLVVYISSLISRIMINPARKVEITLLLIQKFLILLL